MSVLLLVLLQCLLVPRLSGATAWHYCLVLLPWTLWEALMLGYSVVLARQLYAQMRSETLSAGVSADELPSFRTFVFQNSLWGGARLGLSVLVGLRLEGQLAGSWWAAFVPLWVALGAELAQVMWACKTFKPSLKGASCRRTVVSSRSRPGAWRIR